MYASRSIHADIATDTGIDTCHCIFIHITNISTNTGIDTEAGKY